MSEINPFLSVMHGKEPDRIPVWFMRQAGRYLPGYKEIRKKHTIKEISLDPELVSKITLEPVNALGVDAAIIFSDIMLPAESMGFNLDFKEGIGPIISNSIRKNPSLRGIHQFDESAYKYPLEEAIKKVKSERRDIPLIGFSGGPLTIMSYLLNGGPDKDIAYTKSIMYRDETKFNNILNMVTDMTIKYAKMQIRAGIDAFQIFDSWVGFLSPFSFRKYLERSIMDVVSELRATNTPLIYFSTGSAGLLCEILDLDVDLDVDFLSLDWRIRLSHFRKIIRRKYGLQGNLDPQVAALGFEESKNEASKILNDIDYTHDYIFNLGHGVLPQTKPDTLKKLVEYVHSFRC